MAYRNRFFVVYSGIEGTFVIPNKLLEYYESLVNRFRAQTIDNPNLREYVAEIRDVWEQRVILRELRTRAGIPICRGEVVCLDVLLQSAWGENIRPVPLDRAHDALCFSSHLKQFPPPPWWDCSRYGSVRK
jgi:hypothetical protein